MSREVVLFVRVVLRVMIVEAEKEKCINKDLIGTTFKDYESYYEDRGS